METVINIDRRSKVFTIVRVFEFISAVTLPLFFSVTSHAQVWETDNWANMRTIEPHGYVCYRADEPITIDGKLDELSWRSAPWTGYFVDIEGDVKPRPRFRTQVKMLWDDRYFYIVADMQEPHVWGTLTEHDSIIYNNNDFEIFIDPNSDNHEYYEIEINALNTEWDLILRHPNKDFQKNASLWEIPGLVTAVHVDGTLNDHTDIDRGWSVEFAIPWDVLGEYAHMPAPPREGDRWRVNFSRVQWRHEITDGSYRRVKGWREDNWVWSPQGIINMHRPEKWGYVQFTYGKAGTVPFLPDPAEPARIILHDIYFAQKDFHTRNGRYASQLDELVPVFGGHETVTGAPVLESAGDGYRATVTVNLSGGKSRKVSIDHEYRIIAE